MSEATWLIDELQELRRCIRDRMIMVAADRHEGRYDDEAFDGVMSTLQTLLEKVSRLVEDY